VPGWTERTHPPRTVMSGRYCRVEPLVAERHARDLHRANLVDANGTNWTYLSTEPPADFDAYLAWVQRISETDDPLFYAIVDQSSGLAVGVAAFLRIDVAMGVIEVGHVNFSPALQRTRAATEAMFVMMRRVFDELGYRRYEWKCDSLNAASRRAAERLGFTFEGIFRQAVVYKGRNRDSAWFSIIDREWPLLKGAYQEWLAPENFDPMGRQRSWLADVIARSRTGR
jgi:RimJ/RimL family protein N-acetyltransferase